MAEYSPKRRTALVLAGSGTSGAYHAGALKALEEAGTKLDLVVGSGVGTIGAVFAAAAAGARLYGPDGFWAHLGWSRLYRLRPPLRVAVFFLGLAFGVFLLPVVLALVAGVLFPLVLVADLAAPGLPARLLGDPWAGPGALRDPFIASLALPVFMLAAFSVVYLVVMGLRHRQKIAELFESAIEPAPAAARLRSALWEVCRGRLTSNRPTSDAEVGRRFVALLSDNLGQPGFRELILRVADLETGDILPLVLLGPPHAQAFLSARARSSRREDSLGGAVDLHKSEAMLFDAVLTGVLPPIATPVQRVVFPRDGLHGGEVHRLTEATAGAGISEAVLSGAEQVILVSGVPEVPTPPRRRRGFWAMADGVERLLERQAVETDLRTATRINRMVHTVGHRQEDGSRSWEDPACGRTYREVAIWVIRPERRSIGPLEWDGSVDPATEVRDDPHDLVDAGYRDAQRLFVEPILGGSAPAAAKTRNTEGPVQL